MVAAALDMAEAGLAAGELPIGAVVVMGDQIVGRAFTQENTLGRRLTHADLLAMTEADDRLGLRRRTYPLRLAVNLEPCLMCVGVAVALGISEIHYALESPGDGGAHVAASWRPGSDAPWFTAPKMFAGVRREESRALFRRYCEVAPDSGLRRWARSLVDLPQ